MGGETLSRPDGKVRRPRQRRGLEGHTFVTRTVESSRPTTECGTPAASTIIWPAASSRVVPPAVKTIRPSRQWTVISPGA